MIIWGFKARTKTLGEGTFYSPSAGRDAQYKLLEARRWFTIFFIPLIPLKVLGTYVECQATGATYDPAILHNATNADFVDQLVGGVREVVAKVALADGQVSDRERQLAVEIIGQHVDGYDHASFDEDLTRSSGAPLDERLRYLAGTLSERGKEDVLTAAARMMTSDGTIDGRDRDAVQSIGEQLMMSPAHVRGVIETAASSIQQT